MAKNDQKCWSPPGFEPGSFQRKKKVRIFVESSTTELWRLMHEKDRIFYSLQLIQQVYLNKCYLELELRQNCLKWQYLKNKSRNSSFKYTYMVYLYKFIEKWPQNPYRIKMNTILIFEHCGHSLATLTRRDR